MHLNKPPPYEYLRTKSTSKSTGGGSIHTLTSKKLMNKLGAKEFGVFRQEEPVDYKPFDEDRFRVIVAYALQKKETSHTTDDKRNLSHMSVHRTAPHNSIQPIKLIESLKKVIEDYAAKIVILACSKEKNKSPSRNDETM